MVRRSCILALILLAGCGGQAELVDDPEGDGERQIEEVMQTSQAVTCTPRMSVFPVAAPHNIGYDHASCSTGSCRTSCPDQHANSDWHSTNHQGIDVFAYRGAPLVAVAAGTVVKVGRVSSTSGIRVRLRDECGWEYYYGHLDEARVSEGQRVVAGQVLGLMGNTGTGGVHLHFNVSPDGNYNSDINPFNLLLSTSNTDCSGGFTPLHRHYSPFTSSHFYSRTPITNGAYGLSYEGTEGRIAQSPQAGTVPLHQLHHPDRGHMYSADGAEISQARAAGYTDDGAIGFVYPASSGAGSVAIHGYWNPFSVDWLYTRTPIADGAYGFGYQGVRWRSPQ